MKKYKQQDISSGVIKCISCEDIKSLNNFYLKGDYYSYTCKECYKKKHKNNYKKVDKVKEVNKVFNFIVCNKCGKEKPVGDYLKRIDGYYNKKCKECRCVKSTKINPERNDGYKTCYKCKLDLPITEYYYKNGKPNGSCKKCRVVVNRVNNKKWRNTKEGKLKSKEAKKRYKNKLKELKKPEREEKKRVKELLLLEKENRKLEREKNKELKIQKKIEYEKLMEYWKSDEWQEIKKEKERKRQGEKWKRKWENDELFAMKVRIRNLIRNTFRKAGHTKPEKRTEGILGCNYDELKSHLESQFVDGMSWDNRGEWHIDHIIPLSSATNKESLIELSHYTNLQPLWAEDNLEKSNKII